MEATGTIQAVTRKIVGTDLIGNHALGASVLNVGDTLRLPEPDGFPIAFKLGIQSVLVSALNDDTNQVTLTTGLGAAATDGDRLELDPPSVYKVASVRLEDAEELGETVDAYIDQALFNVIGDTVIPTQSVELRYDGEQWWVTNVLGDEPAIAPESVLGMTARVSRISSVSTSNNTESNTAFDQIDHWFPGFTPPVIPPNISEIVIPYTGRYVITGLFTHALSGTGRRETSLYKRAGPGASGTRMSINVVAGAGGFQAYAAATTIEHLNAGEEVYMIRFQNSGSGLAGEPGRSKIFLSLALIGGGAIGPTESPG